VGSFDDPTYKGSYAKTKRLRLGFYSLYVSDYIYLYFVVGSYLCHKIFLRRKQYEPFNPFQKSCTLNTDRTLLRRKQYFNKGRAGTNRRLGVTLSKASCQQA